MDATPSSAASGSILVVTLERLTPGQHSRLAGQIRQLGAGCFGEKLFCHPLGAQGRHNFGAILPEALTVLAGLLRTLGDLQMVVTCGVSAHLATLDAYGIAWPRVPFRPGRITLLPDGLILANFRSPATQHLDQIASVIAQTGLTADLAPGT